jgi:hypothetical protein
MKEHDIKYEVGKMANVKIKIYKTVRLGEALRKNIDFGCLSKGFSGEGLRRELKRDLRGRKKKLH